MEVALGVFGEELLESVQDVPTKAATTAMEYLRQVQREAARCPDVVVAQDYKEKVKEEPPGSQIKHIKTVLTPAPKEYLPSLEWQHDQASTFAELRQSLNQYKTLNIPPKYAGASIKLPKVSCQDHWCRFCLGEVAFQEVKRKRGEKSSAATNQDDTNNGSQAFNEGNDPLLSIITRLGQCEITDVLEYHVSWLQQVGFSDRQGKWLFALMACLEKPLLPNVASLLRNLARRCADLRALLPGKDDERLAPLNLIIAIVTRYFDQTDLADEC